MATVTKKAEVPIEEANLKPAPAPTSVTNSTKTAVTFNPPAVVDPELSLLMRDALRRHAKAVVVITCLHEGQRYAMAATACVEVSMNPPSLLICVNKSASIHLPLSSGATKFGVNILSSTQQTIAAFCSGKVKGEARFEQGNWAADESGTPYLSDAQASFFCDLDGSLAYGSHVVFIGRVSSVKVNGPVDPLVYVNGTYTPSLFAQAEAATATA